MRISQPARFDPPLVTMLTLFIAYCVVFSILSFKKYQAFNCDLDMGNMLQAFYSTLEGRIMEMTWNGWGENGCMFRGHTELILLLIFPFFMLFPHAGTLLLLQTIAIGSGGIALFLIARHIIRDSWTPVVLALCYWLFPLLASINLVDFHADSFIIAPHLFAWYFYRTGRYRWFWCSITLGMLVKEHVFLFNGLLGLMLLFSDRKRAAILLILAVVQCLAITPIVSLLAGNSVYHFNFAQHVVGNPDRGFWETIVSYAEHFRDNLFNGHAAFVLMIALILNVTIIAFPRGLIMIVPLVMIFIAAGSVQHHRHAILIAPLFITLVEGIARLPSRKWLPYSVAGVLVPVVAGLLFFGDSLVGITVRELFSPEYRTMFHYKYTNHDAIADSLIQLIPPKVPVASSMHLRTKLVDRQWSFAHPAPADSSRVDYYFFDFFEKREYDDAWPERSRVASLLNCGKFSLLSHIDGLLLLEKKTYNDSRKIPILRVVDTAAVPAPKDYEITKVSLVAENHGFIMSTRFCVGTGDDALKHAFISFFIDPEGRDTIRVLHLASYTQCRLESLKPGIYDETFYFDLPPGRTINHRYHEVWLFKKTGYLPFFARRNYQYVRVWTNNHENVGQSWE
jgi:uncharacterized membrane protein